MRDLPQTEAAHECPVSGGRRPTCWRRLQQFWSQNTVELQRLTVLTNPGRARLCGQNTRVGGRHEAATNPSRRRITTKVIMRRPMRRQRTTDDRRPGRARRCRQNTRVGGRLLEQEATYPSRRRSHDESDYATSNAPAENDRRSMAGRRSAIDYSLSEYDRK